MDMENICPKCDSIFPKGSYCKLCQRISSQKYRKNPTSTEPKACMMCGEIKPAEDFDANRYAIDGLKVLCMSCDRTDLGNTKFCRGCFQIKEKRYFAKAPKANDKLRPKCAQCLYREKKGKYIEYNKSYQEKYRKENAVTLRKYFAERYQIHKESINEKAKKRLAENPHARMAANLRSRMNKALHGICKSQKTIDLLGCSIEDFILEMELLMTSEMNWNNYGSFWHIDHIKPCHMFDLTDPEQQKLCFHYSNLQPLDGPENISKSDKTPAEYYGDPDYHPVTAMLKRLNMDNIINDLDD